MKDQLTMLRDLNDATSDAFERMWSMHGTLLIKRGVAEDVARVVFEFGFVGGAKWELEGSEAKIADLFSRLNGALKDDR